MPLAFTGIYKLSDVNQNLVKAPQIAMAPRKVQVKDRASGKLRDEYQFLVPNDVNLGHTISGEVGKDDEHSFEIEDSLRQGDDDKPVLWRFEPLTLKLWNEMGEKDEIGGWEALKDSIKDDEALLHFYRYEWLLSRLEWWHEKPESSEPSEPTKEPKEPEEPEAAETSTPTE